MPSYDFRKVEKKWQDRWEESGIFRSDDDASRKKFYALDMFPYPSGDGLHVGHPESYTATDIISRKRRMEGWNVLHPMGFDAFGLPAENHAIKKGIHPRISTERNTDNFRRQLKSIGFSYDWSREISTCDPAYYRWTQWLFLFLYRHGLAYRAKAPVNWCDSCQTVLANEQVEDGICERCRNPVRQKDLEQWFFRVTEYADRLLDDLEGLDWPDRIKNAQSNWIGRSEGAEIVFRGRASAESSLGDRDFDVRVFTTRPDTLFGVTYLVVSPENPLVLGVCPPERRPEVMAYMEAARKKSELQRVSLEQDKTGVPLGVYVTHPMTGEPVPVWVADYVVATYGTGAVMGVPAHDDRDFAFAEKYGLPVVAVIAPPDGQGNPENGGKGAGSALSAAHTGPGVLVNSGDFNGMDSVEAQTKIVVALEDAGAGRCRVQYHLRDWLVSRQRYWGAPIPIVYCDECGEVPVPESDLPVLLPDDVDFRPTGESPLARSADFHRVKCPKCGKPARRESDTMDTFVDSSWYFLRYCSPNFGSAPFDSREVAYWCPVDLYVGGAEHAVLHLMYARFLTKALNDHGLVGFGEPFLKLRNQGLIMGEDGQKMSKSRGNVINPDEVIERYGADTLRLYEMFMGDFEAAKPWDTKGITGCRRFLDRVWLETHDLVHHGKENTDHGLTASLHRTVRKVSGDIESFKFNTAIAALMSLLNDWQGAGAADREFVETFIKLLSPFAPHLAEEMWELLGHQHSILESPWPSYDEKMCEDSEVEIGVQVNGKVRGRFAAPTDLSEDGLKSAALDSVRPYLEGKEVVKVIVIRGRVVSIVVK
ncbi:leucine--tRNA ligase [Candidatus Uhrbacteria bacterium]|nr:leucine--tRNA ligase [Candidatus Uhrbacteria bacterium]